jgi:hypothetical protein
MSSFIIYPNYSTSNLIIFYSLCKIAKRASICTIIIGELIINCSTKYSFYVSIAILLLLFKIDCHRNS